MTVVTLTTGELRYQVPWSETFEIQSDGKKDLVIPLHIPKVINDKTYTIEELLKMKATFLIKKIIFGMRYEDYFKNEPIVAQLITRNNGSYIELIRSEIAINAKEGKYIYSDNIFCGFNMPPEEAITISSKLIEENDSYADFVIKNLPKGKNINIIFTLMGLSRQTYP